MNNFKAGGETIRYTNGTGSSIASGGLAMAGRIAGVAVDTIANGATGVLQITGVVELPKASSLAIAQGDAVYWSGSAVTKTGGQSAIGVAHAAAASSATVVQVLLNATSVPVTAKASNGFAQPFITYHDCTAAAATITLFDANFPRAARLIDVIAECTTANASGTIKITDGTNDITDAITLAVNKTLDRAATIDDAYSTLAAGATVEAVKNAAADQGNVTLFWLPL